MNTAPTVITFEVWLDGEWKSSTFTPEAAGDDVKYWRRAGQWKQTCELVKVERTLWNSFDTKEEAQ